MLIHCPFVKTLKQTLLIVSTLSLMITTHAADLPDANKMAENTTTPSDAGTPPSITQNATQDKTPEQDASILATQLGNHLAQIENTEAEHGPYSDLLGESLLNLGNLYHQDGQFEQALDSYKRALHIEKINAGLYSLGQINILSKVIDSHMALGHWKAVGEKQNYLAWIYRRQAHLDSSPTEHTEALLGIAERLAQGHLSAYIENMESEPFYHLLNAQKLFKLSVRIIDNHYGALDSRMITPLQGLSATSYYLNTYKTKSNIELNNSMSQANAKAGKQQINYDQITYSSYRTGRAAIERILEIYKAQNLDSARHQILSQVALADWEFLFNRKHSAMDLYSDAYSMIQQQDSISQAEYRALFDQPAMIPDQNLQLALTGNISHEQPKANTETNNTPFVLVRFDVSRFGEARNIEVLDAFPENTSKYKRDIRERLDASRFRPRFKDGQAQTSYDIVKRYDFKK